MQDLRSVPMRGGGPRAIPYFDPVCRRRLRRTARILILISAIRVAAPPAARAQELTLSVAISMKEAVEKIGRRFVRSRVGARLHHRCGGSEDLQKQIEAGAPVDVLVSAAERQMDELERRGVIAFGENVRQVLEYVARGEAEAGFVYATDLASRPGSVQEAFRPPQGSYTAVTYPAAVVTGSQHPKLGGAFIESLLGEEAQKTLGRLGFQPPKETR